MGVTVRQKPKKSGIWWIFISHHGRRISKKIGRDKAEALRAAKKIQAKLALNDLDLLDRRDTEPSLTFAETAEQWLEGYVRQMCRAATYERYRGLLERYILPKLGKKQIDRIKRGDIRTFILQLHKQGMSRSSLELARDVLPEFLAKQ